MLYAVSYFWKSHESVPCTQQLLFRLRNAHDLHLLSSLKELIPMGLHDRMSLTEKLPAKELTYPTMGFEKSSSEVPWKEDSMLVPENIKMAYSVVFVCQSKMFSQPKFKGQLSSWLPWDGRTRGGRLSSSTSHTAFATGHLCLRDSLGSTTPPPQKDETFWENQDSTPLKFKETFPENGWLEDDPAFLLGPGHFSGASCLSNFLWV